MQYFLHHFMARNLKRCKVIYWCLLLILAANLPACTADTNQPVTEVLPAQNTAHDTAQETAQETAPVVLVLGDSLSAGYGIDPTQGWVNLLDQWLQQRDNRHKAVNISISGETTSGGLARLPEAMQRWQPEVVIVALGGNDGLRATELKLVENNLSQIIALCREHDARVVLTGMRIPPNYGPRYAEAFFAIYAKLANLHSLPLVPFLLDGVATDPALMQADGLHPGVDAQLRIVENVKPALTTVLEG